MKTKSFIFSFLVLLIVASACTTQDTTTPTESFEQRDVEDFIGRWALYLPGGAGWLEVRQEDGYLDADMLWYGGSVVPVSHVYYDDGSLYDSGSALIITRNQPIVRTRDENNEPLRVQTATSWLEFGFQDNKLMGTAFMPNRNGIGVGSTEFEAEPVPPLPPAPDLSAVEYGDPITLFNGTDVSGWSMVNPESVNGFVVENGVLINNPVQEEGQPHIRYGNLRTDDTFEDFNLKLEVNVPQGSNSGVYLRGIYEIQVVDSYGNDLDSHNMGGLYSRVTPTVSAEKPAGEWQEMDMTLCNRHLTVVLNGTTIIDNQPVLGVTGGALTADEMSPGPIYLQGDHGRVLYRNMVLTPIVGP